MADVCELDDSDRYSCAGRWGLVATRLPLTVAPGPHRFGSRQTDIETAAFGAQLAP
jgi:hypothetical protein